MKKCNLIYLFGGAMAMLLGAGLFAQDSKSDSPRGNTRQAWEHLALENKGSGVTGTSDLAPGINKLGDQGWQLVDVEAITRDGTTQKTVYFFKRRK